MSYPPSFLDQRGEISEHRHKKPMVRIIIEEDDESPDYLLPSNGGQNPHKRDEYVDEMEEAVAFVTEPGCIEEVEQ